MGYTLSSTRTLAELGILIVVILYSFRRPMVGFLFFVFVACAVPSLQKFNPYIFTHIHAVRLLGIVALVGAYIDSRRRGVGLQTARQNWLIVLLFGLMCLSRLRLGQSLDHQDIIDFSRMIFVYFIITGIVSSRIKLKWALWATIAGLTLVSWTAYETIRTGTLGLAVPVWGHDKNSFALALVMAVPIAATFLLSEKFNIKKGIFIGILGLLLVTIMRTYSRGGYLGLFIVLAFILARLLINRKWRKAIVFFVPLLFFLVVVRSPQEAWDRIETMKHYEEDPSATNRILFWKAGLNMMATNPLLGVGTGNFGRNLPYYIEPADAAEFEYQQDLIARRQKRSPHNMFILIGSESGVFAFAVWILVLLQTGRDIRYVFARTRDDAKSRELRDMVFALTAGLTGWALCGIFISPIYRVEPHIFIALVAASRKIVDYEFPKPQKKKLT